MFKHNSDYIKYIFPNGIYWQSINDLHTGYFYKQSTDGLLVQGHNFRSYETDPLQEVFKDLGKIKDYDYLRNIYHWQLANPSKFRTIYFHDVNKNDSIDSIAFGSWNCNRMNYTEIPNGKSVDFIQLTYKFPNNFELPLYLRRNPYHEDWDKIMGNLLVPNHLYVDTNYNEFIPQNYYWFTPHAKKDAVRIFEG